MTRSTLLTVLMTLSLFAFNPAWGENEPDWHAPENYRLVPFEFPVGARHLYLVDLNADKQRDLLIDMSTELLVVFQSETGFDVSSAATITFEDANVAWDLAKGYSPNRNTSILALIDGRRVEAWNIDGQTLSGPHLLLDDLNAYVPEGQQTMRFCRDVNSDGIDDLLIPTTDSILIYLRTIQGEFRSAGTVKLDGKTESRLVSDQLGGTLGQSVTIPALVLRDVNGDGFSDLVVQTDEMLEVTIADPATDTFFPDSPTYARDFSAFQDRMKRVGIDDIDFSDLFSTVAQFQQIVTLKDIDDDQFEDLVIQTGNKVILYRGQPDGINDEVDQVLRLSQNVIAAVLLDYDKDGQFELFAIRAPQISIGRVLLWIALPQSIRFDVLIYEMEHGSFSRRPIGQLDVKLKLPSVISAASKLRKIESSIKELGRKFFVPFLQAAMDADVGREILMIDGSQMQLYWNVLPKTKRFSETLELGTLVAEMLRSGENEVELDLLQFFTSFNAASSPYDLVAEHEPVILHTFDIESKTHDLLSRDLNDDELDDVFIFDDRDDEKVSGMLLLSKQ